MKPILKWVGAKTKLLPLLKSHLPISFKHYYEPFAGSAALAFALERENTHLNDQNYNLIMFYTNLAKHPYLFLRALRRLNASPTLEYYYSIRHDYNQSELFDPKQASRFWYLNKTCYRGLYRSNSLGKFNTPWNHSFKAPTLPEEELLQASKYLRSITLSATDFEVFLAQAKPGDFVYFDPPYHNTYNNYTQNSFSEADQQRLASCFKTLTKKGVYCLMSNSNTQFIKDLYSEFNILEISVPRGFASHGHSGISTEVLIKNY